MLSNYITAPGGYKAPALLDSILEPYNPCPFFVVRLPWLE